jgi:hypothetical protein
MYYVTDFNTRQYIKKMLLFIREYKVFKKKEERDIQYKSKTQQLYKYICYVGYYNNYYRPHKRLHYIFCFVVYLYYVLYFSLQNILLFLLSAAATRSINFNITFLRFRNNNQRLQ